MVMIKINLQSTWRYKIYLVSCYFSCISGVTEFYNHKVMGFNPQLPILLYIWWNYKKLCTLFTEFKHNKVVLCERTIKVNGLYLSRDTKPSGWYCGLRESMGLNPRKVYGIAFSKMSNFTFMAVVHPSDKKEVTDSCFSITYTELWIHV